MSSHPLAVRPPALVVIGRAGAEPTPPVPVASSLLLRTLPAGRRALIVGGGHAAGNLASACRTARPDTDVRLDPDGGGFDLFVLADGWQSQADPAALLRGLHALATPGAVLHAEVRNEASLSMLQRWLEADLSDDDGGPLGRGPLRHASQPSVYKLLLDSGWLPTQVGETQAPPVHPGFEAAAVALAGTVGVPAATAQRQWRAERLAVHATRAEPLLAAPERLPATPARFDVVVPTTREQQLHLNVERSPGLAEVGARIVSYRRAASAADAFDGARPHIGADWILYCHQDVYFPEGFGRRLEAVLAGIAPEDAARTLIGFAGMGVDAARRGYENAGLVIDRRHRFDHPASDAAVSIDELAIVVARDTVHRIDPALGWHLWATDLCLTAIHTHRHFARIVRLPLFHNSSNDHQLPAAFHASAERLAAKYPGFGPIPTLCGTIDDAFLAQHRQAAA